MSDDEKTVYEPTAEFRSQANAGPELQQSADADREAFWAEQANRLHWHEPFDQVLDWTEAPVAKWFVGGKLNVAYNCVDRHVEAGNGDRVAIHFEGEAGDTRTITYADLQHEVAKTANALAELGVGTGDTVAIYMPMIPELPMAMLACTRIGAAHSVIFGGFSPDSIADRVNDGDAVCVITADAGRITQVLDNLLSNAIKFTPTGGQVSLRLLSREHGVDIIVRDTGIGIDNASLPHLTTSSYTRSAILNLSSSPLFFRHMWKQQRIRRRPWEGSSTAAGTIRWTAASSCRIRTGIRQTMEAQGEAKHGWGMSDCSSSLALCSRCCRMVLWLGCMSRLDDDQRQERDARIDSFMRCLF